MERMTGYLAPQGYLPELLNELTDLTQIKEVYDRLVFASGEPINSAWAQNIWINPKRIPIESISSGARALRNIQRNWSLYSVQSHRRAQLISEKLPMISPKPRLFPSPLPTSPLGSWTLVEDNLLIAASECSSPFPNGELHFQEDKLSSPSRAYLKLWEALTLVGQHPISGNKCLDMGSSPGGWTWALQALGAEVISVDKALLTSEVSSLPRVQFIQQDAFTLDPHSIGPIDWFFSDVICYPHKLYELVQKWLEAGTCKRFICTLKFQGKELKPSDLEVVRAFGTISGSSLRHLSHNKHELTWLMI